MIERMVQKIFSKPNFQLSKDIPLSYIIQTSFEYIFGLTRGFIRSFGFAKVGSKLVLGRGVKLRVKSKMNFGKDVRLGDKTFIDALSVYGLHMGNGTKLGSNSKIVISGNLSHLGKGIWIGENSSFSDNTFFGAAGGIKIGKDVIAGQNVRFHAENHNYSDLNTPIRLQGVNHKGIEIGDNVWIGAGAVFLDGAKVGDNSVVAANSVVQKKFSDNSVIGGVPAKRIKKLNEV